MTHLDDSDDEYEKTIDSDSESESESDLEETKISNSSTLKSNISKTTTNDSSDSEDEDEDEEEEKDEEEEDEEKEEDEEEEEEVEEEKDDEEGDTANATLKTSQYSGMGGANGESYDDDEEDDDDEDMNDAGYLQKFNADINRQFLADNHPECVINNYDEINALTTVVRDANNNIIDKLHQTLPYLTKYERARILGQRAKQINSGAKAFVKVPENVIDGYLIAELELAQKRIPFIIRRPIPGGGCEYWKLKDLEIIGF